MAVYAYVGGRASPTTGNGGSDDIGGGSGNNWLHQHWVWIAAVGALVILVLIVLLATASHRSHAR